MRHTKDNRRDVKVSQNGVYQANLFCLWPNNVYGSVVLSALRPSDVVAYAAVQDVGVVYGL
jgi:hypothetical protein